MKKKLLSILLAAIMVVTLLPVTAWAVVLPAHDLSVTKNGSPATIDEDYAWDTTDTNKLIIKANGLTVSGTTTKEYISVTDPSVENLNISGISMIGAYDYDKLPIYINTNNSGEVQDFTLTFSGENTIQSNASGTDVIDNSWALITGEQTNLTVTGTGTLNLSSEDTNFAGDIEVKTEVSLTISGSLSITAKGAYYPIFSYGDLNITGSTSLNVTSGRCCAIKAYDGDITINTSGTVTADTREIIEDADSCAISSTGGNITIGGKGSVTAYADNDDAIYAEDGNIIIKDTVSVTAENDCEYAAIYAENDMTLNTFGTVVANNKGGSALCCDETLRIGEKTGKIIARGYCKDEYGAIELYDEESFALAKGVVVYGSVAYDADETAIDDEATYKYVNGEYEAYSLFVGDTLAQSVLIKGVTPWAKLNKVMQDTSETASEYSEYFEINDTTTPGTRIITLKQNITAEEEDVRFVVPAGKNVILDLNGKTINRGLEDEDAAVDKGNVFTVNGKLTIQDNSTAKTGKITGGTSAYGAAIISNGETVLESGTIAGCKAVSDNYDNASKKLGRGGAIYVPYTGTFNMSGGKIENCSASVAGGAIFNAGKVNITGGKIDGCSVSGLDDGVTVKAKGGAVYNYATSHFTMTDGEISGNKLDKVADMRGAGVYAAADANIILGGTAKITGNIDGAGKASNLFLYDGVTVTLGTGNGEGKNGVAVPVTEGDTKMSVGVTMQTAGVFTGANEANYSALFTADTSADYQVANLTNDSNKLKLVTKYDVTVTDGIQNGTVTTNAANNKAFEGDTVTVTVVPSAGYQLTTDSLIVFPSKCAKCGESVTSAKCDQCGEEFNPLKLDQNQNGTYTFTMPAYAVTVSADFELVPAPVHHGGGASSNAVELSENIDNGKLEVSPEKASAGQTVTVTVTPDKGFTLETITVLDKNGKEVEVKNLGGNKFSFEMPSSKVSISATFMEDNSMLNFFVDVPANEYYYDAVKWAAENGITDGVDATHFAPNMGTTRAQVVTFLWRAAGCPVVNYAMNFEDIPEGTWYTEAVRWAASEMITDGTSTTTFSPSRICTRGQIVTFIARFAGVKDNATGYSHDFTDVNAANYYNNAVAWAYENEITEGTSVTTFSPDKDCTRAQIVTFLYRYFVK